MLLWASLIGVPAMAQTPYWVFFKDRATASTTEVSPTTQQARIAQGLAAWQATDARPKPDYVSILASVAGAAPRMQSRWLNAVSICLTADARVRVTQLPFVARVQLVRATHATGIKPMATKGGSGLTAGASGTARQSRALQQIGGGWLQAQNLNGTGIQIGLIDAGFGNADLRDDLKHLFAQKLIRAVRDFEAPSRPAFFSQDNEDIDDHGTQVLSLVAGTSLAVGRQGGATHSTFVLARTDNANKEYRREEDYWVQALEWMDSLGVRLVNTSLGYGLGFDDPAQNHPLTDVDGSTNPATHALTIASKEKGITVVVAAGNDGALPGWGIINIPADAPEAITVGATLLDTWEKAYYSGTGPASLPYVKPDVCAYSVTGTSFSAPIITGAVACLMQRYPNRIPSAYADALRASGHLAAVPNNYAGYGVPNLALAAKVLQGTAIFKAPTRLTAKGIALLQLPAGKNIVVYHKTDSLHVASQQTITAETTGPTRIVQEENVRYTTLSTPKQVWEITWE